MEPPEKNHFPMGIFVMNVTLYIYTLKRIIFKHKNKKKKIYRLKMAAKLLIFALRHFDFGKLSKTTLSKEFFNEIWLIIGDYEYITLLK